MIAAALAITSSIVLPTFGRVAVYVPAETPARVVLMISDSAGWTGRTAAIAEQLRGRGALVAGVDYRSFRRGMEWSAGCTYPAGDLEDLSRAVQLQEKVAVYQRPILAGLGSGGTIVYAALVSAPEETFAGGVSVDYSPLISLRVPLCEERQLVARRRLPRSFEIQRATNLKVPWRNVPLADLVESIDLTAPTAPPPPVIRADAGVADLDLIEVQASVRAERDVMAILLTGDGGWAEIDKSVAAGLAAGGVPTVGWSSLRYYWTPRTPQQAAGDLARVVNHYARAWNKTHVILVGYSFGADVLPFLVARLPPPLRDRVAGVALLGLDAGAAFEFHIADWIGGKDSGLPTAPEVAKLTMPVLCVQGKGDTDSACPSLRGPRVEMLTIGDGHHFGGEYARVAAAILASLQR